ncbi:MAG: ABC-F family ATP-binding cassette domain-containing protein [Clostridia bacterium]|nr:ABC-F family ATP-binding cassette domain-containing protein [Clostridia bacterium]
MVQAQHITITQKKDNRVLIEDFSFVVNDGEKAALIGEKGNGKSTLLKWLYDPALVEPYAEVSGQKHITGVVGYLGQELTDVEQSLPVWEYLERICALSERSPRTVSQVVRRLDIPETLLWESRPMRSLSGGERVKVRLCALLLHECDVLLLDEPSNDLDLATLTWLEGFLQRTPQTVLYVSHDETLLERTAEMILHIEQIRRKTIPRATAARLPYRQYMDERERRMAHQAQVAAFEQDAFRKKKERYLSIYNAVEHAQASVSRQDPSTGRLLKKKMHTVQAIGARLEKEQAALTEAPEAEWAILPKFDEGVSLPAGKIVLDFALPKLTAGDRILSEDVRLHMAGPERVVIIGQNGCGKSTLLKTIADALLPRRDLSVGYMPQDYDDLLDAAASPIAFLAPQGDKETVTKARLYLGSMKYTTDEMTHSCAALSGGQRAKLLLLKMILDGNNVLLLDEPTRNFSPLSNPAVRNLLRAFGGAILAVSHDRMFLREVATRIVRMTPGGLVPVKEHEI